MSNFHNVRNGFQKCVKMDAIFPSLIALKIFPVNEKNTRADNNSAAEIASIPTAIEVLW